MPQGFSPQIGHMSASVTEQRRNVDRPQSALKEVRTSGGDH